MSTSHPLRNRFFHATVMSVAASLLFATHAQAMSNYKPRARDAAIEAGCTAENVTRAGREGDRLLFSVECADGSPSPAGLVSCNAKKCTFSPRESVAAEATQ